MHAVPDPPAERAWPQFLLTLIGGTGVPGRNCRPVPLTTNSRYIDGKMARAMTQLALTLKGTEELALRTYRLDIKLRNILFLIQKGTPTTEAILQNSIFPRDEVIEKLRLLLKEQFVEASLAAGHGGSAARAESTEVAAGPATVGPAPYDRSAPAVLPTLEPKVSMSQARFLLSDFCLDQFGAKAQPLTDAIEAAGAVADLQQVLDGITAEVRKRFQDQVPALLAKVREINQTAI